MSLITIIFFLFTTIGFGMLASISLWKNESYIEKVSMSIGIGLAIFIVTGITLNLFRIALDWKIFTILALISYVLSYVFQKKKIEDLFISLKSPPKLIQIIVLLLFLFASFMYISGSFSYEYLEDGDPWAHAEGVEYVSQAKTVYDPTGYDLDYLDPYPPGYDMILGIFHQLNNSVSWTLKFFNGLFLALGILFFYFFAKIFVRSSKKALFSTFVLLSIPSFFTHFIWAHSLVVILIFPALYCLERIEENKKWIYLAMIALAAIYLTQPSQGIKIAIMIFIYFVVKSFYYKKLLKKEFIAQIGAFAISLLWWARSGLELWTKKSQKHLGTTADNSLSIYQKITEIFGPSDGTATRAYSFNDFFLAQSGGGINIHVGWGIIISILLLISLLILIKKREYFLQKQNYWMGIAVSWFIFTFLGVNSMTFNLPVGLIAFRFWLLLAIPVALLSSISFFYIMNSIKSKKLKSLFIITIIILILFTSAIPKYEHNTNPNWPPGSAWTSIDELEGYLWLKFNTHPDSKIFTYGKHDRYVVGIDRYSCFWCENVANFREDLISYNIEEINTFLIENNYDYFIISGMGIKDMIKKFGEENVNSQLNSINTEVTNYTSLSLAYQTNNIFVFKVNS